MMIIFLYVLILLPLYLFFVLHKSSNKHIHFFSMDLVTTFHTANAIDNYKLHTDSSSTITLHVMESPPPPKKNIGEGIEGLVMTCTENLGFQTINISDDIVQNKNNNNNDYEKEEEDEDNCWTRMRVAEGRGNFPPPLSSLNENGQPSFILVPVRKNGRLQLSKVRIKRRKILYATRQDGRLRLFFLPDQCVQEEEEEQQEEKLVEEEIILESKEKEELIMEPIEKEEEEDKVIKEVIRYEENNDNIEWKFPNERFRKCHQVVNHIPYHHHHHHVHLHVNHHQHLHMYGVGFGIA